MLIATSRLCSSCLKVASLEKSYFENYVIMRGHYFQFTNFHLLSKFTL